MNVRKTLYSFGLGVIYPFLPVQSTAAQFNNLPRAISNPTDDYSKKSLEELKVEQAKLLDRILESQDLNPWYAIEDLKSFYKKISHEEEYFDLRSKLVLDGKARFEQIFLRCLKDLENDRPEIKRGGYVKLNALEDIFPWHIKPSIGKLIEAKKNSALFFNEILLNNTDVKDPASLNFLTAVGFILLPLADENESYPEKFADWLNDQGSKLINSTDKNEEGIKHKIVNLELALKRLICSCRYPYLLMPEKQRADLILKLMPNYTKLVELNGISLSSDETIKYIKAFISDYTGDNKESIEKLKESVINLFVVSCKSIIKEEDFNTSHLQTISLLLEPFKNDDENTQYTLAELTIKTLQDKKGNEVLSLLLDSIILELDYEKANLYFLVALAYKCQDHIKELTDKKIDALQSSKNKSEQTETLHTLLDIFGFVNLFRGMKVSKIDYIKPQNPQDKYFLEHISTPISNIFLSRLQSETVTVKIQHNVERYINNRGWEELNKHLSILMYRNSDLKKDVLKIIGDRLKTETSPHVQEQLFRTSGTVLPVEVIEQSKADVLDFLKQEIIKEQPFEANRGIGRVLVGGILAEKGLEKTVPEEDPKTHQFSFVSKSPYTRYSDFLYAISDEKFINGEKSLDKIIGASNTKRLSPLQGLVLDLIKITRCDIDTAKKFMPDSKFETKEEKEALSNLRNNSLIILAGIPNGLSEIVLEPEFKMLKKEFEKIVIKILEDEFNKDPFVDMSPKAWAYAVTALLVQYDHGDRKNIESKLANLSSVLFLNNDSVFKCIRDNRIRELMKENGISSFVIDSPDKKNKMEEITKEVTKELTETKQLIANVVLSSAPSGEVQKYTRYLKILGYDEFEIEKALCPNHL